MSKYNEIVIMLYTYNVIMKYKCNNNDNNNITLILKIKTTKSMTKPVDTSITEPMPMKLLKMHMPSNNTPIIIIPYYSFYALYTLTTAFCVWYSRV